MKIIKPSYELKFLCSPDEIIKHIESCARVCYKSENLIKDGSAESFLKRIVSSGHDAVLEHGSFTVKFICDRGISHEIVRHRVASYCQESTRYCNYSKDKFENEVTVIEPCYLSVGTPTYNEWLNACSYAENAYFNLLSMGSTPQEARAVLPNSLKTEVVMTANIREWRHFLKLRTAKAAHPQMRELCIPLLKELQELMPVLFGDIKGVLQ